MKRYQLGLTLALALAACGDGGANRAETAPVETSAAQQQQAIAAAIADPGRETHKTADARRKPAELMAFAGPKAGDRILDLIPGDGYFTKIFSKVAGPQGKVYAVWPEPYAKVAQGNVATLQALSASADYGNIVTLVQPGVVLTAPEPLDLVWTSLNYHDYPDEFMGGADPAILNEAVFKALKPGGIFIVVDHASAEGRGMRDTETLHRIDPETVKQQVRAAGFDYVGETAVLANPADPRTIPVFDPSIRGRTGQFALKFRKPLG